MTDQTEVRHIRQLRRLSLPIMALLSIALALLVLFAAFAAVAILFLFEADGAWRAGASFSASGVNLSIVSSTDVVRGVPLDTLDFGQRAVVALLALVCAACGGLAIFHLRQLFALYSRGVVFAADNIRHIKRFGLWLVIAAIAINGSGRVFFLVTGEPAHDTANAAMALIYGGMIWAIAHAMQLGRAADIERKEFV